MIIVEKQAKTLEEGLENLKEGMIADYKQTFPSPQTFPPETTDRMTQEYIDGFELIDGKKFIKVVGRGSAKAFIVKKSGTVSGKYGGFEEGDILKANTWTAPAKNGARGNVLKGNYKIKWTGPLYFN